MIDEQIRGALAPYQSVEAAPDLRRRVLAADQAAHGHAIRWAVGVAAAAALVVGAVVLDDDPPPDVAAGRPALHPNPDHQLILADGELVAVEELFDAENLPRMQDLFAAHGAELLVRHKEVSAARDGQVLDIQIPRDMAEEPSAERIKLVRGGRVEVTVGRAGPQPELTLYEQFPEIPGAIVGDDPVATGESLETLGFTVRWVHITAPGEGVRVASPPPGTYVLSVLGPNGEWDDIAPDTDTLMVEVAAPGWEDR